MRRGVAGTLLLGALLLWAPHAWAADATSPEDVLKRYLQAVKDEKFDQVYDLVSQAMRQGKDKEAYVKEQKAMMAYADVKITLSPSIRARWKVTRRRSRTSWSRRIAS